MSYVLMELTKVTDRVDALENQSNDDIEETKSVGGVNIHHIFGLSDLIQSRNSGNAIQPASVDPRITKDGFHFSDSDFQQ